MVISLARRSYGRLGRRYFALVGALEWVLSFVVTLGGVAVLLLYEEMSLTDFVRIALVAVGALAVENLMATWVARGMLRPVERWLDGTRDEGSTVAAWRALAELPIAFLRRWKWVPLLLTMPPVAIYATLELELPA